MSKEPDTKEYSKEKMEFIQKCFDYHREKDGNNSSNIS